MQQKKSSAFGGHDNKLEKFVGVRWMDSMGMKKICRSKVRRKFLKCTVCLEIQAVSLALVVVS